MVAGLLVVMTAIVAVAAIFTYRHVAGPRSPVPSMRAPVPSTTTETAAPTDLAADFAALANGLHAKVGVAVSAIGNGQTPVTWGDWAAGPAWSTIKVPLVIAAYRQQQPPQITAVMKAAVTESDNASAEAVWASLGDATTAAQKVQQVLRETGDPTTVESRKVRPEYTAFGQTIWSLVDQVKFTAGAFCNSANDPIFTLMTQVEADQKWGIGNVAGAPFKGGWGPSPAGKYLVRQFGVLSGPAGKVAVAIAAEPASGSFEDGTNDLGHVAKWLTDHLGALPAGGCGH